MLIIKGIVWNNFRSKFQTAKKQPAPNLQNKQTLKQLELLERPLSFLESDKKGLTFSFKNPKSYLYFHLLFFDFLNCNTIINKILRKDRWTGGITNCRVAFLLNIFSLAYQVKWIRFIIEKQETAQNGTKKLTTYNKVVQ